MPPTTATALIVLAVSVLPGALYAFGVERHLDAPRAIYPDGVTRLVGLSAVFDLLMAWPAYGVWRLTFAGRPVDSGAFALAWTAGVAAFALPFATGAVLGGLYLTRHDRCGWERVRRVLSPAWERRVLWLAFGSGRAAAASGVVRLGRTGDLVRVHTVDGGCVVGRLDSRYVWRSGFDKGVWLAEALAVPEAGGIDAPCGSGVCVPARRAYVPAQRIARVDYLEPERAA
ncbi:MAG: hypothetical protein QOE45_2103 [Frankiaceae bacterium]|jgi:hypothetical protein|nr:hypothetical protein [Frankiaceae bacterium]